MRNYDHIWNLRPGLDKFYFSSFPVKRAQDNPYFLRSIADLLPNTNWVIADQEESNLVSVPETISDSEPELEMSSVSNLDSATVLDSNPELETISDQEPELKGSLVSNPDLKKSSDLDQKSETILVSNPDSETGPVTNLDLEKSPDQEPELEGSLVSNPDSEISSDSEPENEASPVSNLDSEIVNSDLERESESNSIKNPGSGLESVPNSNSETSSDLEPESVTSPISNLDSELSPVLNQDFETSLDSELESEISLVSSPSSQTSSDSLHLDSNSKVDPNSNLISGSDSPLITGKVFETSLDSDLAKRRLELSKPGFSFFPRREWMETKHYPVSSCELEAYLYRLY